MEELKRILAEVQVGESREELSPETQHEAMLLQDFRRGNEIAFLELYTRYEFELLMYCRKIMPSESLAQDVFQDTWFQVMDSVRKGIEIRVFKAFLFRSAR